MSKRKYGNSRERFLDVAEARTNAVLDRIRILGNCSNKSLYNYSPEEINKIFRTIQDDLDHTKAKFRLEESRKRKFKL